MPRLKQPFIVLTVTLLMSIPAAAAQPKAAGRSFEECQARAVALGIPPRSTTRVYNRYLRYKAAGMAKRPTGVIARCMAGTG
jgi:hypothetical protein